MSAPAAAAAGGDAVYSARRTGDVAYAMGLDGTPAADWVKNDPRFFRAYKSGLDKRGAPKPPASSAGSSKPPAAAKRPASTRPARRPRRSSRPGYLSRAFSPSRAADRLGASKVMAAGDGGGLLLALVVWPLVLATIQHGAKGPKLWFDAKWLNKVPGDEYAPMPGPARHSRGDPGSPHAKPGRTYYKIAPDGKGYVPVDSHGRRIPGGVEIPRLLPGMQLYPGASVVPS